VRAKSANPGARSEKAAQGRAGGALRCALRGWALGLLIAGIVALGLLGSHVLDSAYSRALAWLIAIAVPAIVTTIHARSRARRSGMAEALIRGLRAISEGQDPGHRAGSRAVPPVALDESSQDAFDELVRSLRALRQEKRRAEMVLANMADGIIAVDRDFRVTLFNEAAVTLLNLPATIATGCRLADLDVHPELLRVAHDCVSGGLDVSSEIRLPGWPQRVLGVHATPFKQEGSDAAMVILHDLSEVRRHEQHQKEFVSNVSHELKTPITAVRTTAEALLAGAKNDDAVVDRFLNNIISESDRLSVLIEDLMEIARMDSGIATTERSDVDLAYVVSRALDAVRPQADSKGVTITVRVEEGLTGYCDELQSIQMIRNLVDNAVKYTPEGGRVEIDARSAGLGVEIVVADSGIGIPHGEVDRIFERFYRVDKARSRRLGGTGLGLAIVKEIVKAHGGEIKVDTQLGRGSTFTVALPGRGG
jgi:two-component system phosphate regulon sensor histidine kinase PhoR